jgi:transcriptional regulator with PAS, ATPase and Fis domain
LDALEKELKERHGFQKIIGRNEKMQEVYKLLDSLADTDTTVLITGESGTGKELIADALHYGGVRAAKPMIEVNCAALAENLLESEIFGHVRGAYTGAVRDKAGRFEAANGGTIFLDEIGDVSPRIQLKLLRVLQEKEFERVGDSKPIRVDVRVIAATNRNLKEKIRRGEFREDLYYRLKVVEIMLPPLRDRLDDLPLLADHFLSLFSKKFRKTIQGFSDEAMRALMHHRWPGNVRELMHAIEHACLLSRGEVITLADLPPEVREPEIIHAPKRKYRAQLTPETIMDALNRTDWNKAKAGRLLGVARQTIHRKIEEFGLCRTDAL